MEEKEEEMIEERKGMDKKRERTYMERDRGGRARTGRREKGGWLAVMGQWRVCR